MFDKQDIEAQLIMYIFGSLDFEYGGMGGKPTGFKYQPLKDNIKWNGLKPKEYIPLIRKMFITYVNNIQKT